MYRNWITANKFFSVESDLEDDEYLLEWAGSQSPETLSRWYAEDLLEVDELDYLLGRSLGLSQVGAPEVRR